MDYKQLVKAEREKARRDYENSKLKGNVDVVSIEPLHNADIKADTKLNPGCLNYNQFKFSPFSLEEFRIGKLPSIYYIPDIINLDDELNLMNCITSSGNYCKNVWKQLKTRRLQCWGKKLTKNPDEMSDDNGQIPPWLEIIADKLIESCIFDARDRPDHVLINQYEATEGILHHTDGPVYLDTVAILSLSSSCLMTFRHKFSSKDIGKDGSLSEDVFSVLLQPRSLLVFSGIIYSQFMHGIADGSDGTCQFVGSTAPCINMDLANVIEGQKIQRGKRTSLTLRKVLEKP